jgi:serine/threonine-protein phosphatase 2A regulatory subunit B
MSAPTNRIMLYEPLISKLSQLYGNNLMNDRFTLSVNNKGSHVITGGYNNMFHIIDLEQHLNTQILIDEQNEKTMNQNLIRKINAKGSCPYKKDDPIAANINYDKKILHQRFSPSVDENFISFCALNCIYTYTGKLKK